MKTNIYVQVVSPPGETLDEAKRTGSFARTRSGEGVMISFGHNVTLALSPTQFAYFIARAQRFAQIEQIEVPQLTRRELLS